MDRSILLFGFDLSGLPKWAIMAIGVVGVFGSFMLQGTAHESIFNKYKLKDSLFLTFVQFLSYASLSFRFFVDLARKKAKLHAPFWFYVATALFLVGSMALSNFSLERISYPTQVLFRSSKLIPVMLGSFFFLKKRYSITEILAVILIVVGLIGISVSDKKFQNKFDTIGLIAVIASLFCDAFASNLEDKAFSTYQAPQSEVIAIIYLIGSLLVGAVSIPTGQFTEGIKICAKEPGLVVQIILFSYLGALGIQFIYLLIKSFGSVATVMITSLRKAFTVCLSFIMFPEKVFTIYHFFSILSIAAGIALNIYGKKHNTKKRRNTPPLEQGMNVSFNGSIDQFSAIDKSNTENGSLLIDLNDQSDEQYKA